MTKMRLDSLGSRIVGAATAVLASVTATSAADCPRRDALGTSRVLVVDAKDYSRVGLHSFSEIVPLVDHEVVLTFDDGPRPPSTQKVLAALVRECARATFFLVGRSSAKFPELVRRIAALGHTIAHHSWSHPIISKLSFEQAKEDIELGVAADEMALNGIWNRTRSAPFFRFPYLIRPLRRSISCTRDRRFGADLWASLGEHNSRRGIK